MDETKPINPKLKVIVSISIAEGEGDDQKIVTSVQESKVVELAYLHVFNPDVFKLSQIFIDVVGRYFQVLWRRAE